MIVERIASLLEPVFENIGLELVSIKFSKMNLEILIDRLDHTKITIEDCKLATHAASVILDVENAIDMKYYLEVSSSGIERPLTKLAHFRRFTGEEARIRLKERVANASHYKGKILSVTEDKIIILTYDSIKLEIPFELIKNAHLIMSDEMFKKIINNQ